MSDAAYEELRRIAAVLGMGEVTSAQAGDIAMRVVLLRAEAVGLHGRITAAESVIAAARAALPWIGAVVDGPAADEAERAEDALYDALAAWEKQPMSDSVADQIRSLAVRLEQIDKKLGAFESSFDRAEALARLIEADPHQYGTRPCSTCTTATAVLGRPFGCVAKAKKREST